MFGTSNKAIDIYGLQIRSVDSKFILEAEVHEVDHKELPTLKNPKCTEIMAQFSYLNKLADVIKCLLGNTEVIFPRSRQDWILMHLFKPTLWSGIYPYILSLELDGSISSSDHHFLRQKRKASSLTKAAKNGCNAQRVVFAQLEGEGSNLARNR